MIVWSKIGNEHILTNIFLQRKIGKKVGILSKIFIRGLKIAINILAVSNRVKIVFILWVLLFRNSSTRPRLWMKNILMISL